MGLGAHILVVDDDIRICKILDRYMTSAGYRVKIAVDSEEMRESIRKQQPDLVILDLQLPGEHGLELARALRKDSDIGIIIVTGTGEPVDKIVGLELGADDYLTKPVDDRELLARVRNVLRRVAHVPQNTTSTGKTIATFSGWTLDLEAHELKTRNNDRIHLTSYEFQLLSALVNSPNRVLSRDQIMDEITARNWTPSDRSVDVLIGKLRKKLNENSQNPNLIKTIRGSGYIFTARVSYLV